MVGPVLAAVALAWQQAPALPVARSEVAGAVVGTEVVVAGGFLADGSSTARVDAFSPARSSWRRLPDLPVPVNHAMAAGYRGRLYVVGGYNSGRALSGAYVLGAGRWRAIPSLPQARAAGGAAVVGGRLYVAGGVAPGGLARSAYVLDLRRRRLRWRSVPGPRPREHLGVAALGGRVYAAGGRTSGFDTNLTLVESYAPGARAWVRRPSLPSPRGGTGLAAVSGRLVSAGGEAPSGTIASVYAYRPGGRWTRLPDLPTARHGLAVVGLGGRVYVIGGGIVPGLSSSAANEVLALP